VCTGMPGSLPVLNKQLVEYAMAVGLATNCQIHQKCKFDRKNYFYPDNPQNYQISQLYLPICHDGWVEIETEEGKKRVGIHEIHMEEDAGKLIHDEWEDCSLVDYNRSGGAIFLGLKKTVVKAHGSSKAETITVTVLQAVDAVEGGTAERIAQMLPYPVEE